MPLKTKKIWVKSKPAWFTSEIHSIRNKVGKVERDWRRSKDPDKIKLYSDLVKSYKKPLKVIKYRYVNTK